MKNVSGNVVIRTGRLALVTGLLFSVGAATVDFSLPTLPSIQRGIGTPDFHVELTLTLVFLGLAISQLVYGAIADKHGRRRPLLIGMVVYCAASLCAAFSPTIVTFAAARLAQALGYGVVIVLIRSAVADVCDERGTARVYSSAITMMAVASVLAPAAGGQLVEHVGWRAVFLGMALFGFASLAAAAWLLPETLPAERRANAGLSQAFKTYAALIRNGRFLAAAAIGGGAVAYQFTYNTGAPALVIDHYGLTPATAGALFSLIALSTAVTSQVNAFLLKWIAPERIMMVAIVVSVVASSVLLWCVFTSLGGVAAVIGSLFVLIATLGFIAGNAMAAAIAPAGAQAGAASALVGVMQFLFGTCGSALLGVFRDPSGRVMGVVIGLLSLMTLIIGLRTKAPRSQVATA
jgi:DHA1 family bicyclomycin/chloramphenicol resistance-like MFS transporter